MIKKEDGSHFAKASFNDKESADNWIAEEQTRPYWKHDQYEQKHPDDEPVLIANGFTYSIEDLTPPARELSYKLKRAQEYPSIGDQLDAIYKKLSLGEPEDYDAIAAKIDAVKKKHPKPE